MTDKQALRRAFLSQRRALVGRAEKDAAIARFVMGMEEWRQARQVLLYLSLPDEPDTLLLARAGLSEGKELLAPACGPGEGEMAFFPFTGLAQLRPGRWGILEPQADQCAAGPVQGALCLVPGLAFDRAGVRLGYGKGYYDRFLAGQSLCTVGLCYDDFFMDSLPAAPHDQRVARVVTETGVHTCGR